MITKIRHDWPEKAGFMISRPNGHKNYTFLHLITATKLKFGNEIITTRPNACIFYEPNVPQWYRSENDMIHNWMHCSKPLGELLQEYKIPCNKILYPEDTSYISDIFYRLESEYFGDNQNKEKLMDAYLNEFLIKFSRSLHSTSHTQHIGRKLRRRMQDARQQMLSHPEHPWTVAEIAAIASLSPSRFHTVYKLLFASSPMRDLISARIDYAKSLLVSDEEKTVLEISEKLGYNDQYHFIRQFKAVTGKTPGAYRKAKK